MVSAIRSGLPVRKADVAATGRTCRCVVREEAANNLAPMHRLCCKPPPATAPVTGYVSCHLDVARTATGISVIQTLKGEYRNGQD